MEMMPKADPDFLHHIEGEIIKRNKRVREIIAESGPEAVAEFDRNMKDIQTGVSHARNIWHSLSAAQRRAMTDLSQRRRTARHQTYVSLMRRELIDWHFTEIALTEHGRFVLKHGPQV